MAFLTASCASAKDLPALYKEACAPWSVEQAARLPSSLTPDVILDISQKFGAAAGKELAAKKEKVSALTDRFRNCDLNGEDLKTADRYLDKEFRTEVHYFVFTGCGAVRESLAGQVPARPERSASFSGLEGLSTALADSAGAARFFDGYRNRGAAQGPEMMIVSAPAVKHEPRRPFQSSEPLPVVPPLSSKAARSGRVLPPMPDIKENGRVNMAITYWTVMREKNWRTYKAGRLTDLKTVEALGGAAAGGFFQGLLVFSNLQRVEEAAARLGWDVGQDAPSSTITVDSLKLFFQSRVFLLLLLPIPFTYIIKAALAGVPWALLVVAAIISGFVNRYVIHFAD